MTRLQTLIAYRRWLIAIRKFQKGGDKKTNEFLADATKLLKQKKRLNMLMHI